MQAVWHPALRICRGMSLIFIFCCTHQAFQHQAHLEQLQQKLTQSLHAHAQSAALNADIEVKLTDHMRRAQEAETSLKTEIATRMDQIETLQEQIEGDAIRIEQQQREIAKV